MKILLKNIDIITGEKEQNVIQNGVIGIQDGIIRFVGPGEKADQEFKADKIIDGKNGIAMPGLVNAHTHSPMTLLRNIADDLPLEEWLFNRILPIEATLTPEDVYWGAMLGIAEMIKSGTTCFADMYLHMEEVARAVEESGIRSSISMGPITSSVRESGLVVDVEGCTRYKEKWHNAANGRIKVYVEIHSVYLFDEESITAAARLAKELGTGIHIHVSETQAELETSHQKYGANPVEVCLRTGIFDVPVIAAHCVHLSDSDIEIIKSKGVSPIHNPSSNLKLGSGIARIKEMLDRGINVCLGTDGPASNNNLNLFEEMHMAALIHKGIHRNPVEVTAAQVIRMATSNGARAVGFGDETGVIREGMKADIILIDTNKPHLCPVNDPVSAVVYSAQASDVDTVIIDGRVVMENRKLLTIDEELVMQKVREIASRFKSA